MKTHKNLFKKIVDPRNLLDAFREASRCKRYRKSVLLFEKDLAKNIAAIRHALETKRYKHGAYRFFKVYDQKERLISAAPFPDRIVHHAIYRILDPIYNQKFIFDSFANRQEKGTHKAVRRLQHFLRKVTRERERERESALLRSAPKYQYIVSNATYRSAFLR